MLYIIRLVVYNSTIYGYNSCLTTFRLGDITQTIMTPSKQKQLERERQKALNELLVAECKSPKANLDSVKTILESGADIHHKNSTPLYWATRRNNFELIKFLIANGALESCENARRHISKMCDHKFSDKIEPLFFEILDITHSRVGDFMTLFTPYINNMMVNGKLDKIRALQRRYYLTEKEIVEVIELRVIFEIVINNFYDELEYIERHKNWIDQKSFDSAVDSGEMCVLLYMTKAKGLYFTPSDASVAKAVYEGFFDILDLIISKGYSFERKPLFLEKACRTAFVNGTAALEYLLKHGYSLLDIYKGRSILEHAEIDKNKPLLLYLETAQLVS